MGIYEDLLNGLTNSSCQLQDIFLKLKILATRLKNTQLKNFVESELNGYDNIDNLPSYRRVSSVLMGTVENLACRRPKVILPVMHLEKEGIKDIQICIFTEKIIELENYAEEKDLNKPIPPEFYDILSKTLENGYRVTNAYVPISNAQIKGVLAGIRNAVLDLMMSMEEQFTQTELDTLFQSPTKEQLDKANPIINQFFITSFGSSTQNTKIELESDK
ncbi:MAG: hypothetical protein ACLSUS_05490 [Opitutales bacterium]|nr:hypothetical protein [Clostridium sp.]